MKILVLESEYGKLVYCKNCGAIAGEPSKCPIYTDGHSFIIVK